MKQGTWLSRVVMLALTVGIAIYLGFYIRDTFHDPFTTALAYPYTVHDSVAVEGILVRKEQVLPAQSGIVEPAVAEGERVGVGQSVAFVYRDSQAQTDQSALDGLETEIALLKNAMTQDNTAQSAGRIDEQIFQGVVALRAASARGDFSRLESQVSTVKSSVLKRGHLYGEGVSAQQLSARLSALLLQQSQLHGRTAGATAKVTASATGIFSSLVDGYESLLTPDTLTTLTPSALAQLRRGSDASSSGAVGKLITSNRWYFAITMPTTQAARLKQGNTAQLRFSGDFTQEMDMLVEYISPAQEGAVVVVVSSDRYLSRITLLRQVSAEVVFQSWSGLRVPKHALRMEKSSKEDQESGQTTQSTQLGVYVLVGGRAEFKPAQVVAEGEDYYVLAPATSGSRALRGGDEVIVNATGLWNGQLLEF